MVESAPCLPLAPPEAIAVVVVLVVVVVGLGVELCAGDREDETGENDLFSSSLSASRRLDLFCLFYIEEVDKKKH